MDWDDFDDDDPDDDHEDDKANEHEIWNSIDFNILRPLMHDIVRARIVKSVENKSLLKDMAELISAGDSDHPMANLLFEVYIDVIHKEYPQYKEMLNSLF